MATTCRPIEVLLAGVRDTTGAVVASGNARFYQPGTLVAQTVYSDSAGTTPITQPKVLNAGGQATVYMLEPVRMIVKDSTDTTTILDVTLAIRHDQVYITSTNVNGGVETTLENWIASITDSNTAFYLESTGATTRSIPSWMRDVWVSVKDFNAKGDDSTDDTAAIQAAIDHCIADSKPVLYFPAATYKINGALTMNSGNLSLVGAHPKKSLLKQYSTSANSVVWSFSSTNVGSVVRDLGITASTTTSGAAFSNTNANKVRFFNCETALHRNGFSLGSATDCQLIDCAVLSTDGNSASIGVTLGNYSTATDTSAIAATGKGFSVTGTGCRLRGVRIDGACATGINLAGTSGSCIDAIVTGTTTTGITVGAAGNIVRGCVVTNATTGINVNNVASCTVAENQLSSNTTDILIGATTTLLNIYGNTYSTITDNATLANKFVGETRDYASISYTTSSAGTPTWTPSLTKKVSAYYHDGASTTITIGSPGITTAQAGDIVELHINSVNAQTLSWNSVWGKFGTGPGLPTSLSANRGRWFRFVYSLGGGSSYQCIAMSAEF